MVSSSTFGTIRCLFTFTETDFKKVYNDNNTSKSKLPNDFVSGGILVTYKDDASSLARSRFVRQADLAGTASGYGEYYCPEGIPVETALFVLLGAFALAFGALFRAITLQTGGRRKKRSTEDSNLKNATSSFSFLYQINDLLWSGRF